MVYFINVVTYIRAAVGGASAGALKEMVVRKERKCIKELQESGNTSELVIVLTVTSINLLGGESGDGWTQDKPGGEDSEAPQGSPAAHYRLASE